MRFNPRTQSIFVLFIAAISLSLFGCDSGPQSSLNEIASTGESAGARFNDWMLPNAAKEQNLIYISNADNVGVYSYSNGGGISFVGQLGAFATPKGLCTDKAGDVWITEYNDRAIVEYAHGGSRGIHKFVHRTLHPYACAVDPTSGDLAVSYEHHDSEINEFAEVLVYPGARGSPKAYSSDTGLFLTYFLTYDNAGNLFLEASPCPVYCYDSGGPPGLFELTAGGSKLEPVSISQATLSEPSALVWVNPSLLVGDNNLQGSGTPGAYKVVVRNSVGSVIGTVPFNQTQQTYGFTVRAGRIIVPDQTGNIVRIYGLDGSGIQSSFTDQLSAPFAAVVSQK
jgi:hypothetical protein